MNIYFVFKGESYYPVGGWDDLADIYLTEKSAIEAAKKLEWGQWSHIVKFEISTFNCEIIKRYDEYGSKIRELAVDYSEVIEEWDWYYE